MAVSPWKEVKPFIGGDAKGFTSDNSLSYIIRQ